MEESRNKRADWEDRLKALLSKFREDNMSDYRMSAEYKDNQEKIQIGYQQLGKLKILETWKMQRQRIIWNKRIFRGFVMESDS